MPNIRQRKAAEAAKRWRKNHEEDLKIKQKEYDELQKKSELISESHNVLSELSKKHNHIQSCIDSMKKEHMKKFEEIMDSFAIEFLSVPSTERPQFQIDESFIALLSTSKPRLEEISEKMKFIDKLIEKISSNSSDISESEQRIIKILSAKSFLRSQVVASVQKMIDFCSNMLDCLELLGTYSNQILSIMEHKIRVYKRNPDDFKVDSKRLELQHKDLNELLQGLSELNENIEKSNFLFSKKSLFECIFFIESDEFSSIFEYTQDLEVKIKETNGRFDKITESFVNFVQIEFNYRKQFVYKVELDNHDDNSDNENDYDYEEPAGVLRKALEASLNRIS